MRPSGWRSKDGKRRPVAWCPVALLDGLPDRADLRYTTKPVGRGTAFFAELDGYVSFFWHDPQNQSGFGGSVLSGLTTGGESFAVKGPWSSSPTSMTKQGFPPSLNLSYTDKQDGWERGRTFIAGNVRVEWFADNVMPFLPGFDLVAAESPDVGDSLDSAQSAVIAWGLDVPTISTYSVWPRHVHDCSGCGGRGVLTTDNTCYRCEGTGIKWDRKCTACDDGLERTLCRTCGGNGIDLEATVAA